MWSERVRLTDDAALDQQTDEDGDLFQWFRHQASQGAVHAQVCQALAFVVVCGDLLLLHNVIIRGSLCYINFRMFTLEHEPKSIRKRLSCQQKPL